MRASMVNKRATLYMARNKVNDKFYIGITSQKLRDRKYRHISDTLKGSNFYFHRALRKYGDENFIWTKICELPTYAEGLEMEKHLIKEMNPAYNTTKGGEGCLGIKKSEETKKKLSIAHTGKKVSEETKRKLSEINKGKPGYWLGKKVPFKKRKEGTGENISKGLMNPDSKLNRKKVICLDTGEIFPSVAEAGRKLNLVWTSIAEVCRKQRNNLFGKVYRYIDADGNVL